MRSLLAHLHGFASMVYGPLVIYPMVKSFSLCFSHCTIVGRVRSPGAGRKWAKLHKGYALRQARTTTKNFTMLEFGTGDFTSRAQMSRNCPGF